MEQDSGRPPSGRAAGQGPQPPAASSQSSIPSAALDALRNAAFALAQQVEIDMMRDFQEGVDGSYLDAIREAVAATYPALWTEEQVAKLNEYQGGYGHAFTCPNRSDAIHRLYQDEDEDLGQLIATKQGWLCCACGYRQFTAHDFMFDGAMPNPFDIIPAQGIEAGTDETPKAIQPEGRKPGPEGAP